MRADHSTLVHFILCFYQLNITRHSDILSHRIPVIVTDHLCQFLKQNWKQSDEEQTKAKVNQSACGTRQRVLKMWPWTSPDLSTTALPLGALRLVSTRVNLQQRLRDLTEYLDTICTVIQKHTAILTYIELPSVQTYLKSAFNTEKSEYIHSVFRSTYI